MPSLGVEDADLRHRQSLNHEKQAVCLDPGNTGLMLVTRRQVSSGAD